MKYFAYFLFVSLLVSCTHPKELVFEDKEIKVYLSDNQTIFPQKELVLEASAKDTFLKANNFKIKNIAHLLQELPVEDGSKKTQITPIKNNSVNVLVIIKDSSKTTSYYQLKTAEIIENFGYWKVEKID